MFSSHESLKSDYQVSCVELDFIVDICKQDRINENGVCFGARMTGGGFGGCCVVLIRPGVEEEEINAFETKLKEEYKKKFGFECLCYLFSEIFPSPKQVTI